MKLLPNCIVVHSLVFAKQVPYLFNLMLWLFFFFFLLHVSVWLLFEGGVYFFGKPADINDSWIRYIRAMQ